MIEFGSLIEILVGLSKIAEPVAKLLQRIYPRDRRLTYQMQMLRFNEHLYRYFGTYFFTICTTENRYLDLKNRNSRIGLNRVFDTLSQDGQARVILLWAEGGMGKTALASHILRTAYLREKWFNLVIGGSAKQQAFIDGQLRTFNDAILSYSSLLNLMGEQLGASDMNRIGTIKEKLEFLQRRLRNQRALIVIDNLETLANTQEIADGMTSLVANTRGSRVLITTRDGRVNGRDLMPIHVEAMTPEESLEFAQWYVDQRGFNNHSAVDMTIELLKRIANQTGGAPLAIEQLISEVAVIGPDAIDQMHQVVDDWQQFYEFHFSNTLDSAIIGTAARSLLWHLATYHRPSTYSDFKELAAREGFSDDLNAAINTLFQLDLVKAGELLPDIAPGGLSDTRERQQVALYSISPLLTNYILRHKDRFVMN